MDFTHDVEGQDEKVHLSLQFLESIIDLGIFNVVIFGV
jgi:hypothetical protein